MFLFVLAFSSCKNDEVVVQPENEEVVYMSFRMSFASNQSATRAQGTAPSINTDDADREDYVDRLAALVFEPAASGAKIAEEYTRSSFFTMKMKPGSYDFYFIANYPAADEAAIKAMSKTEVETYLQKPYEFKSFQGAKTSGVLFPMARVYRSQAITEGGTFYAPLPFKPTVGAVADKQLKPVSFFGYDRLQTATQDKVNLVRSNAKISLNISGEGKTDIIKSEYVNAAQNYTFAQLSEASLAGQAVAAVQSFTYPAPAATENITTRLYVPERLFGEGETKGWDTANDAPLGLVNYIQITMRSGKIYRIPVITNAILEGKNYLDIARDNSLADYNIIRNNHYHYNINVPMDAKELVVTAEVLPWTLVQSEMSYSQANYSGRISFPEVPGGSGELLPDNQNSLLHQQGVAKISFTLKAPKGAVWRASITNGLDFSLTPAPNPGVGEVAAVTGITNPDVAYTMYITPLKPYQGTPRFTEFYITVNGEEIQLIPSLVADGTPSGPGKRAVFKQVE